MAQTIAESLIEQGWNEGWLEGCLEAAHETLCATLGIKLEAIDPTLIEQIYAIPDAIKLRALLKQAVLVNRLEDFKL